MRNFVAHMTLIPRLRSFHHHDYLVQKPPIDINIVVNKVTEDTSQDF